MTESSVAVLKFQQIVSLYREKARTFLNSTGFLIIIQSFLLFFLLELMKMAAFALHTVGLQLPVLCRCPACVACYYIYSKFLADFVVRQLPRDQIKGDLELLIFCELHCFSDEIPSLRFPSGLACGLTPVALRGLRYAKSAMPQYTARCLTFSGGQYELSL